MDPPRDKAAPPPKSAEPQSRPSQREAAAQYQEPTRPPIERIHSPPGWTDRGSRAAHEQSAIENIKWQKAQNSARAESAHPLPTGKSVIHADMQRAQGQPPVQGQAPERAAAPENAAPKSKAGIKADMYKAMQSQPQQSGPSRNGGRSR